MASFPGSAGAPEGSADWLWSGREPWALDTWSDPVETRVTDLPDEGQASLDGLGSGATAWGSRWASPEPWPPGHAREGADADEPDLVGQYLALCEGTDSSAPHPLGPFRMREETQRPGNQSPEGQEEHGWPVDVPGGEEVAEARDQPGTSRLLELKRAVGGGGAAVTHVVEAGSGREALSEEQREKVCEALKRDVMEKEREQEPAAAAATTRPLIGHAEEPRGFIPGGAEGAQGRLVQAGQRISEKRRAEIGEALKRVVAGTKEGGQDSVGMDGRLSGVASDSSGSHSALATHRAQPFGGNLGRVRNRLVVSGASLATRLAETVQALPATVQAAGTTTPPTAIGSSAKARAFESLDTFLRILAETCPAPAARGPQQSWSRTQGAGNSTQGAGPIEGRGSPAEAPDNRPSPPGPLPSSSSSEDEQLPGNFLSDGRFLFSSLQLLKRHRQDWSVPAVAPIPPGQKLRIGPRALQPAVRGLPVGAPFRPGDTGKGESCAPVLALAVSPAQRSLLASASDGQHTETLRSLLMKAAQTVDSGNIGLFKLMACHLRRESDRQGRASERWVHLMLEALSLRVTKKGALAVNTKPPRMTLQELIASRYFVGKEAPFVAFGSVFATSMIAPRLLGHRKVHIICWADMYLNQIPIIMKALVGEPGAPALGTPRARLERMRVTVFDVHRLVTKRTDMDAMKTWGMVRQFMVQEAAKLGVEMDFQVLYLEAEKMACFETVQPREDEVVAVTLLFGVLRSSEDPLAGGGARVHLMKLLKRMRPVIVAFGEEDCEASGDCFLQRFQAFSDHCLKLFHVVDTLRGGRDLRLVLPFENVWTRLHALSILSCDGPERLVRPLSQASWHAWFRSWGFQGLPVSQPVLDGVARVLQDYSSDFRSSYDGTALWLSWQGRRIWHAACWVLPQPWPSLPLPLLPVGP